MSKSAETVRSEVSKAYAEAVRRVPAGGCCGPSPAKAAAFADYGGEELAAVPPDAAASSFGCGNPVALAGLRPGEVVLDLGSGAGIDLVLAAKRVGPAGRVVGVDMTDEMIARARANVLAAGLSNVEVRKGIIEELPVESGSVDWVISNCVINLSPEKPRVFREIARVLRPGGQMLVSDIVAKDLPEVLRGIPAFYSSCVSGAIDEETYLAGLRAAGLVDVEVRDRLVYDASQLEGLASEASCGCGTGGSPILPGVGRALEGKIWSAKIYGRKPR